jgi:hypothetical protein
MEQKTGAPRRIVSLVRTRPGSQSPTRIRTRSCGGPGRRSYKLHTAAAPGPADIKVARGRTHEPAAERQEILPVLGEPESAHCWTGTTCWAASESLHSLHAPTAVGRGTRLGWVEDYGGPSQAGR